MESRLYYECHVTTEPAVGSRLDRAAAIDRRATQLPSHHLVMMQGRGARKDAFMMIKHRDYDVVYDRMHSVVADLQTEGFAVWHRLFDAACELAEQVHQSAEKTL